MTDPGDTPAVPFINLVEQHRALKPALLEAIGSVMDHGQFVLGPEVAAFEARFADYCGVRYAIGVDNGTSALILALRALGIGAGDEVITAVNSFLASASAIALTGAKPVLVDVRDDFTLDPERVERVITGRTKAIMPVHLTGRPADMTELIRISERHGVPIVEDAAQAVGASLAGKRVGSFGKAGCLSFHPLKVLSAMGDGGMVTTDDASIRDYLIKARNHGLRDRDACEFWSVNARLDTLQAAVLLVKLNRLEPWIEARRAIAAFYRGSLGDVVRVPQETARMRSVYQTFVILAERRDELRSFLGARGIDTRVHYPFPIHLQKAAASLGYRPGDFPVAESQAARILSLPIYPEMTEAQMNWVADSVRLFYSRPESPGRRPGRDHEDDPC